jgi:capsule polysaccharide export protein KpsE/RkpR
MWFKAGVSTSIIVRDLGLKNYDNFKNLDERELYELVGGMRTIDMNKRGVITIGSNVKTPFFPNEKDVEFAKTLSAGILNSAIEGLDSLMRLNSSTKARETKEYVERELVAYKEKLDSVENEIEIFQRENNVLELENQTSALVGRAIDIGQELAIAEIELNLARITYREGSPQLKMLQNKYENLKEQYLQMQGGGISEKDRIAIPFEKVPSLIRKYTNLVREQKILAQVIIFLETQRHQEAIQEKKDVQIVKVLDEAKPPLKKTSPKTVMTMIFTLFLFSALSVIFLLLYAVIKGKVYLTEKGN